MILTSQFAPPYDWDSMTAFLARRAIPGVEAVEGSVYRRGIVIAGATAGLEVRRLAGENFVRLRLLAAVPIDLLQIVERAARSAAGRSRDRTARARAVPGIGPWTAQYIAMRALREPDAFPAGDLGVRKALARHGIGARPSDIVRAAEPWRPFRAYAVMHLWRSLE